MLASWQREQNKAGNNIFSSLAEPENNFCYICLYRLSHLYSSFHSVHLFVKKKQKTGNTILLRCRWCSWIVTGDFLEAWSQWKEKQDSSQGSTGESSKATTHTGSREWGKLSIIRSPQEKEKVAATNWSLNLNAICVCAYCLVHSLIVLCW